MTTLRKLVSEIDFNNEKLKTYPSWESLSNQLNISDLYWSNDTRLTCYFIKLHYCTDTVVGTRAYFLDNELVCISTQAARKSSELFSFVSEEIAFKVRDYLLSLTEPNGFKIDIIEGFDQEIPDTYNIYYNTQILHKTALLDGEPVEIIKTNFENEGFNSPNYFHSVLIRNENGEDKIVDCRILDFKYNSL